MVSCQESEIKLVGKKFGLMREKFVAVLAAMCPYDWGPR